jgi:hypothetical protein
MTWILGSHLGFWPTRISATVGTNSSIDQRIRGESNTNIIIGRRVKWKGEGDLPVTELVTWAAGAVSLER